MQGNDTECEHALNQFCGSNTTLSIVLDIRIPISSTRHVASRTASGLRAAQIPCQSELDTTVPYLRKAVGNSWGEKGKWWSLRHNDDIREITVVFRNHVVD
jgi:hypothetical protein